MSASHPFDAMAVPPELTCVICLGLFDDPCFCSDGWTYCRLCVARWAGGVPVGGEWKSPHTNESVKFPAVLRSNEAAGVAVLEEKKRILADKLNRRAECPEGALQAAACLTEKGRPVCDASCFQAELAEVVRKMFWGNRALTKAEVSRSFAQTLCIAVRQQSAVDLGSSEPSQIENLLAKTGPMPALALLHRDSVALTEPLLCLLVVKRLLTAALALYRGAKTQPWLQLVRAVLAHVSVREAAVDCIEVSSRCFARHQRKAPGVYRRCDQQWGCPPGTTRFACAENGAHLEVQLYPAGAFGALEGERARVSATISHSDGSSPTVFRSRFPLEFWGTTPWELRRSAKAPVFPDYDPIWPGDEADDWSAWGDEYEMGIFEALPEFLPEGFQYMPFLEDTMRRSEDELSCYKEVLEVLFAETLGRPPKRRRRHGHGEN